MKIPDFIRLRSHPIGLACNAYTQWLYFAPQQPPSLQQLLVTYPAGEMEAYPVSTLVNSPAYDRPECIAPD